METPPIRFKFAPAKALAAIHWMVSQQTEIDLHTMLKACYFADRAHLNRHGRPVFGATYRAMAYGPVPLEIYEMAKGEALWLAELGVTTLPWLLNGYHLRVVGNEPPDLGPLSKSDIEALEEGLRLSRGLTFNARTKATHGPDWQRANLGLMRYEDMIDDVPKKPGLVEHLRDSARFMKL